ncbi:MAG TPA: ribonuclease HII [Casimicrobiaceae bacterium]|nr:ribonuclease HII [Casimicrobiaceae bacterium]
MARLEELSLEKIRQRYIDRAQPVSAQVLNRLQRDPRQGARQLYAALKKRYERQRDERTRLDAMRHFEQVLWKTGVRDIAGVDEAGVGPLAGPVVAAAVMFPPQTDIEGVDDSKRLDPETRAELALEIRAKASGVAVGVASVEEIDRVNIYHAALLAMRRAVEGLPRSPQHVLVDARTVPGVTCPQNMFNKGDGINFSIAAASIIAKTSRDTMMEALDRDYPGYGFATHKGYGTPEHREALLRLGPSKVHRMSFPVIHELQGEFSPLFYVLKKQLEAASTRVALDEFETSLAAQADDLPEQECKKLRLLVARRWKTMD